MESILVIDLIDVKTYGMDNGADIEIDDRRLSISTSAPLSLYENLYFRHTKQKARVKIGKKIVLQKIRHLLYP